MEIWKLLRNSYAYLLKHVADESSFVCDGGTIECRMDIHVRHMANISDMNVQATGIAAMDRASGTRPVSISHSGFGHNALNFRGRTPRLRFDRMSPSATTTIHRSEASGDAAMPRWTVSGRVTASHATANAHDSQTESQQCRRRRFRNGGGGSRYRDGTRCAGE